MFPSHPGPIRVLLVDDDRRDFERTRRLLDGSGGRHRLDREPDGDRGLAAPMPGDDDACLVDDRLHGRDGLHPIRDARTPLILLAAFASRDIDVEAARSGAVDFLAKPVTASGLARAIREVMPSPSPAPCG